MIEIDLITKHGKKALGMTEPAHSPRSWRNRVGEILLEIGIIVFAITLSIWLHNWQEHRHDQARARQFLAGLRQDLSQDLRELQSDSTEYVVQLHGMRYFQYVSAATLRPDSLKAYGQVLGGGIWFIPNSSRFEGLKSSGSLGILESDTLLAQILTYYERTTVMLTNNAKSYSETTNQLVGPFLNEHLAPDKTNLVAVMQQRPMQNVLRTGPAVQGLLRLYHATAQEARQLRRAIDAYLRE